MSADENRLWTGLRGAVDALADVAGPDAPLASTPRWDSLAVLLVITHAEQVHGRALTGAQVRACRTGRDLLTLLT
jgi:hypothetical protein